MQRAIAWIVLVSFLAFPLPAAARKGAGEPRASEVVKLIEGADLSGVDQLMTDDPHFVDLAFEAVDAKRSRKSTGNSLIAGGIVLMVLGALVGAPTYAIPHYVDDLSSETAEKVGIGIMGGVMGLGFVLLIPGIAVSAAPSGAEKDLVRYYDERAGQTIRPDTRLLRLPRPYAAAWVPSWTFRF